MKDNNIKVKHAQGLWLLNSLLVKLKCPDYNTNISFFAKEKVTFYKERFLISSFKKANVPPKVGQHIGGKSCWVFDRGADNTILKDFFVDEGQQVIIRLKKNTKLFHKTQEYQVSQLIKKINFLITQTVTKIKKDKPVQEHYELGAIPISYTIKGFVYPLWLVVSRNKKHGGLCYLLVKSELSTTMEVAKWAFKGYGLR